MSTGYIDIIEDSQTFPYDPAPNTRLMLRTVPDDVEKKARKHRTTRAFKKGREVIDFDAHAFIADMLDYAIVSWTGLRRRFQAADGTWQADELPCTRDNKTKLPEWLKSEISRLCLGKEAAAVLADPDGTQDDDEEPTDPKKS